MCTQSGSSLVHTGTPDTPIHARTYTFRAIIIPCVSAPPAASLAPSASAALDCAVALRVGDLGGFQDIWVWLCGYARRIKMAGIPGPL